MHYRLQSVSEFEYASRRHAILIRLHTPKKKKQKKKHVCIFSFFFLLFFRLFIQVPLEDKNAGKDFLSIFQLIWGCIYLSFIYLGGLAVHFLFGQQAVITNIC